MCVHLFEVFLMLGPSRRAQRFGHQALRISGAPACAQESALAPARGLPQPRTQHFYQAGEATYGTKPHEFIVFGVTCAFKPCRFIGFGVIYGMAIDYLNRHQLSLLNGASGP